MHHVAAFFQPQGRIARKAKLLDLRVERGGLLAHALLQRADVLLLQQFADLLERKPDGLKLLDEIELRDLFDGIVAIAAAFIDILGFQHALLLIEAQRFAADAVEFRHLSGCIEPVLFSFARHSILAALKTCPLGQRKNPSLYRIIA